MRTAAVRARRSRCKRVEDKARGGNRLQVARQARRLQWTRHAEPRARDQRGCQVGNQLGHPPPPWSPYWQPCRVRRCATKIARSPFQLLAAHSLYGAARGGHRPTRRATNLIINPASREIPCAGLGASCPLKAIGRTRCTPRHHNSPSRTLLATVAVRAHSGRARRAPLRATPPRAARHERGRHPRRTE